MALGLLALVVVFAGAFALGRRRAPDRASAAPPRAAANIVAGAAAGDPAGDPSAEQSATAAAAAAQGVPIAPMALQMRAMLTVQDSRLVVYLRTAYVTMMSSYAETGQWPTDLSKLQVDRPANSELRLVSTSDHGLRLTAIDNKSKRQCDLFTGDSAKMAFGYAFDPGMPACGRIR